MRSTHVMTWGGLTMLDVTVETSNSRWEQNPSEWIRLSKGFLWESMSFLATMVNFRHPGSASVNPYLCIHHNVVLPAGWAYVGLNAVAGVGCQIESSEARSRKDTQSLVGCCLRRRATAWNACSHGRACARMGVGDMSRSKRPSPPIALGMGLPLFLIILWGAAP